MAKSTPAPKLPFDSSLNDPDHMPRLIENWSTRISWITAAFNWMRDNFSSFFRSELMLPELMLIAGYCCGPSRSCAKWIAKHEDVHQLTKA